MRQNPITVAFEHVDVEPSATFREQLRAQFLAAVEPGATTEISPKAAPHEVVDNGDGETVKVVEGRPPRRRLNTALGIAASIAIVAALTMVIVNRQSEPKDVDTSHDPAIAKSALIQPDELGQGWDISHQYDDLTSRAVADVAARVPECAAYLDYAFDSPRRQAVTSGRIFSGPPLFALTQWVYIFPTEAAATKAMDKMAEPAFAPCMRKFIDALFDVLSRGANTSSTIVDVPPLAPHGHRQVVVGLSTTIPMVGAFTVMHTFIQVGRGIVYIDPTPDFHDSLDPASRLEKAYVAATDSLTTALESVNG